MFLREITCWARASILGATFPGVASTRGLYPQGPDHYPASLALDPEAHAVREEIGQAEGGEGPSRVPHESPPLAPDGANEEQFPPLQHRDRKPVGEDADIGEGHLRLGHPHSRERGRPAGTRPAPARTIFPAMCSSSRTSLGMSSARVKRARHSRKYRSTLALGRASTARSPSPSRPSIASFCSCVASRVRADGRRRARKSS